MSHVVPNWCTSSIVTVCLCGDVMTGRGVDQALRHPGDPQLHEPYVRDARRYLQLAEAHNGAFDIPVDYAYVWGDAIAEFERVNPDVCVINLETSITTNDQHWPGKRIHYRMHPRNIPVLTAADIDCCVLANNHVLDWGYAGLEETLTTLIGAGVSTVGSGRDLQAASEPAILHAGDDGRVLVYAFGVGTSGIPRKWAASKSKAGVYRLNRLGKNQARNISEAIGHDKAPGDITIVSVHWGGNWGYAISNEQKVFAHELIKGGNVDIVHGHSSHHPKGIEIFEGKPILYGCGDLLNDYEGISGHEEYRDDLRLVYFVSLDQHTGRLVRFEMTPFRMRRLRLERSAESDAKWFAATLDRECRKLDSAVKLTEDGTFRVSGQKG